MRDYGKISPTFWTGETGRKIRALGSDAIVIALYLPTCPSANMIGLFYLPLPSMSHETGLPSKPLLRVLNDVICTGYCFYNFETEFIWIPEMAKHQIGETLLERDNRHKAVVREWDATRKSGFYDSFYQRYSYVYNLPLPRASEAPLKPGAGTGAGTGGIKDSCTETSEADISVPEMPPAMTFPIKAPNGKPRIWPLYADKIADYQMTYPGIDAMAEARRALQWCKDNHSKQKTFGGMPRFLNTWMAKAQDESAAKASRTGTNRQFGANGGTIVDREIQREQQQLAIIAGAGQSDDAVQSG